MIKSLMMIGAAGCLALEAFANTAATYTSGDTSLANGKITFAYDDSGKITELSMKPDYGETLTLTGDTLSFADGAQIITSQQGKPVIANAISADGALRLGGVTNMAWSGSVFDRYSNPNWQTVLTNTRLDDIVPVSSTGCGHGGNGKTVYHPYWIVREGETLRAEFQSFDSTYLYGVHLELQQDGDDIKARVISGGYIEGAAYTNYLGISLFECPNHPSWNLTKDTNTAKKYGFKQLTFGRRYETWDYCGNLLSDSYDTVVATNTSLEDVEILYAACNNGHALTGWSRATDKPYTLYPHHVVLTNGYLYAQFTLVDGTTTKGVKVRFCQSGDDVAVRIVYAAYISGLEDADNDFDVNYTSQNWRIITQEKFDAGTTTGYGIDMVCLRSKAKDKLAFSVDGTWNLDVPFTGDNAEVTFEAASATATVNAVGENTMKNSAYVIKGDADHVMKFYANPSEYKVVLPAATDAYGTGTELHIWGYNKVNDSGAAGSSAITMHTGTKLFTCNKQVPFHPSGSKVVLDGATLELATGTQNNNHLGYLTLLNGSTVCGPRNLCAGYKCESPVYRIAGTGASTNKCKVVLFDSEHDLTLDVEDTVAGADADFIMDGDVENSGTTTAVFVKAGEGTMLMNGQIKNTANANRIVEGELLLGKTGATVSGAKFSIEGGTLGLAAGTASEVADVTLTESSTISVGEGATLTIAGLTVPEGSTLAINGDVLGHVKVSTALDAATLSRIRINGKAAYQSGNGYFIKRGLMIIFH